MPPKGKHYDSQHKYAGDRAVEVKRTQTHFAPEDRTHLTASQLAGELGQSDAATLAQQVEIGDDRAIGSPPNWDAYKSSQLYTMATRPTRPRLLTAWAAVLPTSGNQLAEAANRLNDALGKLDGAWRGTAASSAQGAIQPLAVAAGQAGTGSQLMGATMSQQSSAASNAKLISPGNDFDLSDALREANNAADPTKATSDAYIANKNANEVKAGQVQVMNQYTSAMQAADAQMPVFVPPKETIPGGGGDGNTKVDHSDVKAWQGGAVNDPRQGTSTGVPAGGGAPIGSQPGDQDGDGVSDLPIITGPNGTGASSFPGGQPPITTTPGMGGGPGPLAPHAPGTGPGGGGFGPGFGNFSNSPGGGNGAGNGVGGRPGGAGAMEGNGRNGLGTRGMGPGAMEEGFGRGGRGGAGGLGGGANGRGGMGGMGAGRGGHGDEDEEHQRPSYLLEADPDAVFDTDQMTAPPVIGED